MNLEAEVILCSFVALLRSFGEQSDPLDERWVDKTGFCFRLLPTTDQKKLAALGVGHKTGSLSTFSLQWLPKLVSFARFSLVR